MIEHETLSHQENQILSRIERYFRMNRMSLEDKLFYAKLIVILDLESGHYSEDQERHRLELFAIHVDQLRKKLKQQVEAF